MNADTLASGRREARRAWPVSAARLRTFAPPLVFAVVTVFFWQLLISLLHVKGYIVASPLDIVRAFRDSGDKIWYNAELTLYEAVMGFLVGTAIGGLLGVGLAYSRFVERALLPWVVAANTIPVVAIAPIVILWLGQGAKSKIAVTAFLCFFPLCINTMKGIRSTPRTAIEVMHVQAASRLQEFVKVRLPASLPYVFVGLKLAATFSVIGAIVAEFVGAVRGLGYLMLQSSYLLDTPLLWASMFASAALGIAMFLAMAVLERILVPWADTTL